MDCSYLSGNTVLVLAQSERNQGCQEPISVLQSRASKIPFTTMKMMSSNYLECFTSIYKTKILSHFEDVNLQTKEDTLKIAAKINDSLDQLSHDLLFHFKQKEFHAALQNMSPWLTCFSQEILNKISYLATSFPLDVITNLLIQLFSILLERLLRDLFPYLTKKKSNICPLLVTELIQLTEIREFLGCSLTEFIWFSLGPPFTLNLRNLTWHGFLLLKEVPDRYLTLVLMLWLLVNDKCQQSEIQSLKSTCQIKSLNSKVFETVKESFDINIDFVFKLLKSSCFIPIAMLPQWKIGVSLFFDDRYFESIVVVLPQLEHALRCLFANTNEMPKCVITAEEKTLFTTLDEIFSRLLPSGQPNNIFKILPKPLLLALFDLFVYRGGPRLRDFVSHGEILPSLLNKKVANHLLSICIYLCTEFLYPWRQHLTEKSLLKGIREPFLKYKPVHHSVSTLLSTMHYAVDLLMKWNCSLDQLEISNTLQYEDTVGNDVNHWQVINTYFEYRKNDIKQDTVEKAIQLMKSKNDDIFLLQMLCDIENFPYLEIFNKDSTITLNLLLRIVETMVEAFEMLLNTITTKTELFNSKKMRSRNRANYIALLERLSHFKSFYIFIVTMVAIEIHCLSSLEEYKTSVWSVLKKALQAVENWKSLSSSTQNQWHSCSDIIKKFIESLKVLQ